ncbi:MAG: hypothetical protein MUO50_19670 [Longimicrobiales bacterium]|nr:hypothetical protein [Longimicrobiales bacterium]
MELSPEGVVLVGPLGDQGPQRRIGGKDAVVAVAVDAGRRENLGQTIQELQGREPEGGAARRIGPWEEVEDLVGAPTDEVESFEGEGGSGTVADEAFEPGAVGGLDADAGIKTEPRRLSSIEDPFGVRRAHEPTASNPPP